MVGKAYQVLDQLEAKCLAADTPATPRQIIEMINLTAKTFQVEIPEEDGLAMYVLLLEHLPYPILMDAMKIIMRKHTYRVLPLPGEFLQTEPAQLWNSNVQWMLAIIKHGRIKLQQTGERK